MNDKGAIERGTILVRVLGAIILVAGYWMVQNLQDIVFDGFGGQSIGPLVILVLPITFLLPALPIYYGTQFLLFPQGTLSKSDDSKDGFRHEMTLLAAFGIFSLFIIAILLGGANVDWRSWPTEDGEVSDSSITVLSDCDQSDQACWQLIVRIEFSWEEYTQNVSYEENFTSLTEAEKTENRINDMEHIVVAFNPQSIQTNHYFPEIQNSFYVDIYVVTAVFGVLALGLGVADVRRSKKSQASYENE